MALEKGLSQRVVGKKFGVAKCCLQQWWLCKGHIIYNVVYNNDLDNDNMGLRQSISHFQCGDINIRYCTAYSVFFGRSLNLYMHVSCTMLIFCFNTVTNLSLGRAGILHWETHRHNFAK